MTPGNHKRGAPFGNSNATKHGLYSKHKPLNFEDCHREGMLVEIKYIRAILDYVIQIIPDLENPEQILHSLSSVATASVKLSFLLDRIARQSSTDDMELFSRAIQEVNKELRGNAKN